MWISAEPLNLARKKTPVFCLHCGGILPDSIVSVGPVSIIKDKAGKINSSAHY